MNQNLGWIWFDLISVWFWVLVFFSPAQYITVPALSEARSRQLLSHIYMPSHKSGLVTSPSTIYYAAVTRSHLHGFRMTRRLVGPFQLQVSVIWTFFPPDYSISFLSPICFICLGFDVLPPPPVPGWFRGSCLSWTLFAVSILTGQEAGCLLALRLDRYVPFPWGNSAFRRTKVRMQRPTPAPAPIPGPTGLSEGLQADKMRELKGAAGSLRRDSVSFLQCHLPQGHTSWAPRDGGGQTLTQMCAKRSPVTPRMALFDSQTLCEASLNQTCQPVFGEHYFIKCLPSFSVIWIVSDRERKCSQ